MNVTVIDTEQFFERLESIVESKIQAALHAQQPKGEALPELLGRREVAEFLKVSLGTVDNWARAGVLQKHYLGSIPKFRREELLQAFEGWRKYQRT